MEWSTPEGRTGRGHEPTASVMQTISFAKELWKRKYTKMEDSCGAKARREVDVKMGVEAVPE